VSGHELVDLVVLEVSKDMSILFGGFSGRGRDKEIFGSLFKLSRLNLILLHIMVDGFCGCWCWFWWWFVTVVVVVCSGLWWFVVIKR
jgi:hypothetical protein